jgi:hypothetical protein
MGLSIPARASAAEAAKCLTKCCATQVAPELLAEQRLDVGLVIDHKNQIAYGSPRTT